MTEAGRSPAGEPDGPRVGLFVTCLVDLMRPAVGFAAVRLLAAAGCRVDVPAAQTCCGQPAYNSGDAGNAKSIARQVIETFAGYDYVVAPSGSCAGTLKIHYPEMFTDDPAWCEKAQELANKTFELTQFLTSVAKITDMSVDLPAAATYHDSCSGLRELGIKTQPRELLDNVNQLILNEGAEAETCCGFGGLFCVKYGEVSDRIVSTKTDDIAKTGAGLVLGGDLGCLMNIAGKLKRDGHAIEVRHVAEVLAGMDDVPAIAEPEEA